jgi:hypothetical protein
MFLAKKFTLTPAMKWGVTALGSGLLGILAGFVLGSLLEVGRQT